MSVFTPRKFKAKKTVMGKDDLGASGITFQVVALEKDKIYEQRDPEYLNPTRHLNISTRNVVIDDNACWHHIGEDNFWELFEEIPSDALPHQH